jgi:hypothetical protein
MDMTNKLTYAPVELMTVVFAIQKPQLVAPLTLSLEWAIERLGNFGVDLAGNFLDLSWSNLSTNPYYLVLFTNAFNNTEGSFRLGWGLHIGNCTDSQDGETNLGSIGASNDTLSLYRRVPSSPA